MAKGAKNQIIIAGPDFEEGPHSNIKDEQFFDAIDSTLDTLEQEEERVNSTQLKNSNKTTQK